MRLKRGMPKGHKVIRSPEQFEVWRENIRKARLANATPEADRFWSKVLKTEGCWYWTAAKDGFGYGMFRPRGRQSCGVRAHRRAWELVNGRPFPEGLYALHKCNNTSCVRPHPLHVYPGTAKDNARDRGEAGHTVIPWRGRK